MNGRIDLSLVCGPGLEITVHRADCPEVRQAAAEGIPVMTMLGCQVMPEQDKHLWHSCMEAPDDNTPI